MIDSAKILDEISDAMEVIRINGIAPKGQEGLFLIAVEMAAHRQELEQIRKGITYSADTDIPSVTETLVKIEGALIDINYNINSLASHDAKRYKGTFIY